MGKKRRDGRAAKRGNNNCASSNASARNSDGGGLQQSTTTAIRYGNGAYEREMRDGRPHGKGKMALYTGDVYEGEYVDGQPHGKGRVKWADGEVYDGEWEDGIRNGRGVNRYANGDVYDGEFVDGKPHGRGDYKWADGRVYEGEFKEGGRHGKGTEKFPTGEIYEGIWMKGEFVERKLRSGRSQQRRQEAIVKKACEYCGADDYQYKLRACSGCNLALYCSAACQKAASRSHRRICANISMLPSRDSELLVLKYDKDEMVDLDAGLRYATKHMDNLRHLQINVKPMSKDDTVKLSTKQLSSLLRSKKGALDSVSWLSLGKVMFPCVAENGYDVWKELHSLKHLYLCFLRFDDVQSLHDIIHWQQDTLLALSLPFLDIGWHKAKTRRSVALAVNSCKHLVKLDLDQCVLMDADLKLMLQDLPSLRILNLARNTKHRHEFTDNTCGLIARKCPGLQQLGLHFHYHLSVRGIRKIFEGCPHLRSLSTSSRKLSCKDIRSLLEVAPQLLYLSLSDEVDYSCDGELDEVIEATGGRTVFRFGSGDGAYGPNNVSLNTREKYDRQKDVLADIIWSKQDPDVANDWASMLH